MKLLFNKGPPKIGIEWELLLVDKDSFELSNSIHSLLDEIGENSRISLEAFQSCVEIKTPPVKNTFDAEAELLSSIEILAPYCEKLGIRLCSLAVHPFNLSPGKTTLQKRYQDFEQEYPFITRHHLSCATQIHVSMSSPDEAIRVMNRLRNYLPLFAALSASSPYWHGERTGHFSFRQHLTRAAQNSGIPPFFKSWEEFESYYKSSVKAGIISSTKDIHWDIRPRPDLGTLEFRIMDAMPRASENLALCSFAFCLMTLLKEDNPKIRTIDDVPSWALRDNLFYASHLGLEASFIRNNGDLILLRDLAKEVAEAVLLVAVKIGEEERFQKVKEMINEPPYVRMMKYSSLKELVADACDELLTSTDEGLSPQLVELHRKGYFQKTRPPHSSNHRDAF